MKVTLFMTTSVNGYIARKDGEEDFLSHVNWLQFVKLAEKIGCFVVGRRTYGIVKKLYTSGYNFDTVNAVRIVVSKKVKTNSDKKYIFVKSPEAAIMKARKLGFKELLLTGGSGINSSFMKKKLVNEIIFDLEPFVLGNGINVLKPENFGYKLKLLSCKKLGNSLLQLNYKVL